MSIHNDRTSTVRTLFSGVQRDIGQRELTMEAAVKKIDSVFVEKCIKNKINLAQFKLMIADQIVSKYNLNPSYCYHTSNGIEKQNAIPNLHIAFSDVPQTDKVERAFRSVKQLGNNAKVDTQELNRFDEALSYQRKMVDAFTENLPKANKSILHKSNSQRNYYAKYPETQKSSFISTIIDFLKSLFGFETSFDKQRRENAEKWAIHKNDPQTTPGNSRLSLTTKS
jgi:carotenoid cleavage dioxygenase-like enzyme